MRQIRVATSPAKPTRLKPTQNLLDEIIRLRHGMLPPGSIRAHRAIVVQSRQTWCSDTGFRPRYWGFPVLLFGETQGVQAFRKLRILHSQFLFHIYAIEFVTAARTQDRFL